MGMRHCSLRSLKTPQPFSWKVAVCHSTRLMLSLKPGCGVYTPCLWEHWEQASVSKAGSVSFKKALASIRKEACLGRRGKRTSPRGGVGALDGGEPEEGHHRAVTVACVS